MNQTPSTSSLIVNAVRKVAQSNSAQRTRHNVMAFSIALQRLGAACLQCSSLDHATAMAKMAVAATAAANPEAITATPFLDPAMLDEVFGPVVESAPELERSTLHNDLYLTLRGLLSAAGIARTDEGCVNLGIDLVAAGQHLLVSLGQDAETRTKSALRAFSDERRRTVNRFVFTTVFVTPEASDDGEEEEEEESAPAAATEAPAAETPKDPNSF